MLVEIISRNFKDISLYQFYMSRRINLTWNMLQIYMFMDHIEKTKHEKKFTRKLG